MTRVNGGFTLIELLLVITLMAAVTAIVAPLGFNQIDKIKAKAEWKDCIQLVKHLQQEAYLHNMPSQVILDGKQIAIQRAGRDIQIVEFQDVFFQKQRLMIDSHGAMLPKVMSGLVRQNPQEYIFE